MEAHQSPDTIQDLRREIEALRNENAQLRGQLGLQSSIFQQTSTLKSEDLTRWDIARYSRQLLVPDIGVKGQRALKASSILVVGAGGLGAPSILYLAAAGVGRIGIVDHDQVEASNLQRQVIHDETRVGMSKAASARLSVQRLNSLIEAVDHQVLLDSSNAMEIISQYDIVLDATDNAATRYLLNDACVLLHKTLISASALRMDGQLSVYHHKTPSTNIYSPCYRCIFPTPPPPETVTNCSDGGILGVVTGVMGCIQALEAIRIIVGSESAYAGKLLMFDASECSFRSVKLRKRKVDCAVCGDEPSITGLIDYVQFCGAGPHDKTLSQHVLSPKDRTSAKEYSLVRESGIPHLLLDVRQNIEFDICSLPGSTNIPLSQLESRIDEIKTSLLKEVYVICRRGNDSQLAVRSLIARHSVTGVKDVVGGLVAWTREVDPGFPEY
ncbi:hypothetical protein SmJEL517_g01228 [Synchytrium microbalum]|uniref:Needs CLA4 to survive protein 3 n=1 Tax=Synchytrium microbalum TaxID=1806994 RepID=A0A507CAP5_9FUNG|nr:uncharacterized protein SmJEL517_g01228 [Synchytrium microbalum]TPX36692.1 hypothetical protein SmJEL517_g01228 [Synchytrium microbalum]